MDMITYILSKKYTDKVVSEGINVSPLIKTDNISIKHNDNVLALAGFNTAEALASPIKQADGSLAWVVQDVTQIQNLIGTIPNYSTSTTVIDYINEQIQTTLQGISINGEALILNGGVVDIPLATQSNYGLVKSSQNENCISVLENGSMEVNSLNVNKLTQTTNEDFILNCGNSNF